MFQSLSDNQCISALRIMKKNIGISVSILILANLILISDARHENDSNFDYEKINADRSLGEINKEQNDNRIPALNTDNNDVDMTEFENKHTNENSELSPKERKKAERKAKLKLYGKKALNSTKNTSKKGYRKLRTKLRKRKAKKQHTNKTKL